METALQKLSAVMDEAIGALQCRTATGRRYASAVIRCERLWSGADLSGRAKKFGFSYSRRRRDAARALRQSGGEVRPVGAHGLLCTVVPLGVDDYGNAFFATPFGVAYPRPSGSRYLTSERRR